MSVPGPFVVVGRRLTWTRVALAIDGTRRLLVFDDRRLAERFARGMAEAGMDKAVVGDFADGDAAIVEVLDSHNAPVPVTFEIEIVSDVERDHWPDAAFAYGFEVGRRMLDAFGGLN